MIRLLYFLLMALVSRLSWVFSKIGTRSKAFFDGRINLREKYLEFSRSVGDKQVFWMHCSSLGEFEQGRPVLEAIRQSIPGVSILLTFFSPSGYEVRKNYAQADAVLYLPIDTPANAKWVVEAVRPSLVIFVKYDFWPVLIGELHKRGVPVIAISAIFRPRQIYFRWFGLFFWQALSRISYFFVQDEDSVRLLSMLGIHNVTRAGDSRFDRVVSISQQATPMQSVDRFLEGKPCWVIGSAWPEDLRVLAPFINAYADTYKFIVVPHEVGEHTLLEMEGMISVPAVRWSRFNNDSSVSEAVLLVDTIGLLSGLYRYARYAWVGGAYGKGLHNILEAAVFGVPVFFGDRSYSKFREANLLLEKGGAFTVSGTADLEKVFKSLEADAVLYSSAANASREFVSENQGATLVVMEWMHRIWKS